MATKSAQRALARAAWRLARRQHSVIARWQLLELGFSDAAIRHRIETGRLHPVYQGVYAVGRPELTQHGRWMAAVLAAGPGAVLSHSDAGALWGLINLPARGRQSIDISVPSGSGRRRPGLRIHRRSNLRANDRTERDGIPVTTPVATLVDLAPVLSEPRLDRAIREADRLDLIDPDALRAALDAQPRRQGLAALRRTLDRDTFRITDSELERRFLAIIRRAGLPLPLTQQEVNGFRVDFYWPKLGLVVETDGLRYHRTPSQQARDRLRDQAHIRAGLTPLRFTRAQVAEAGGRVEATLTQVIHRLTAATDDPLRDLHT